MEYLATLNYKEGYTELGVNDGVNYEGEELLDTCLISDVL